MKKFGWILTWMLLMGSMVHGQTDTSGYKIKGSDSLISKDTSSLKYIDDISLQHNDTTTVKIDDQTLKVINEKDSTEVFVDNNRLDNVDQGKDTTQIRLGNKIVLIIKTRDGLIVTVKKSNPEDHALIIQDHQNNNGINENKNNTYNYSFNSNQGIHHFHGHYLGIEFGLNNFVNKNFSMVRNSSDNFMDLNTGRSWDFNLNFYQKSFGIVSDKFGVVTGLGLEFCNYFFENGNTLGKDSVSGNTIQKNYPANDYIEESKLATVYLMVPILLEVHFTDGVNFSCGLIGGMKLGSYTKVVYHDYGGNKETDVTYNDFNLNSLRYGVTARLGYGILHIFANYYITPLFETDKGPELYPITVGLALGF